MSKVINAVGEYKSKKTGEAVSFEYEYPAFESLAEMQEAIGEDKLFKNAQRMLKVDAANTAREKAKVDNGDTTRKVMSEEDKAEAKAKRQEDKALLDRIKALSPSQREALGL